MHSRNRGVFPLVLAVALQVGTPGRLWSQSSPLGMEPSALLGIAALVFGVAAAVVAVLLYRRHQDPRRDEIPLVFPAAPASQPRRARPMAPARRPVAAGAAAVAPAPPAPAPIPAAAPAAPPMPAQGTGSLVDGQTIRFHKPIDGTLQILPGRLEVVGGADTGQSIRFVRTTNEPEVTFGRSDGPPYRHIQLRAPTVSRQHARMRFGDQGWSIANLSQTNPVVLNGQELPPNGGDRPLHDGDHIEMGEVTFLYRER